MPIEPQTFLNGCGTLGPSAKGEQELRPLLREHRSVDEARHCPTRQLDRAVDVVSVVDHYHTVLSWTAENALFVRSR